MAVADMLPIDVQDPGDALTEVNLKGRLYDARINPDALWNKMLDTARPSRRRSYWTKELISEWLDSIVHNMAVPSAYYGDEMGTRLRNDHFWDHSPFRIAAIGGSSYTGLAGNLGIPLVYDLVNTQNPSFVCERSYFPMSRSDLERFEDKNIPLFSLETRRDIKEFDLCMFSGSYCGVDANVMKMLLMSGIPMTTAERDDSWPMIGRGGCHSFSPEPFWPVYDWIYIGDAEPMLSKILRFIAVRQNEGMKRDDILWEMCTTEDPYFATEDRLKKGKRGIPGVYVASFYDEHYHEDYGPTKYHKHPTISHRSIKVEEIKERVSEAVIQASAPEHQSIGEAIEQTLPMEVDRVYIKDLNDDFVFVRQVVSYHDPGMSAGSLLVSRGCNAKCSFCQEGMTWMPYREQSANKAVDALGHLMQSTGSLNVLPSAFCASSYTQKKQLMKMTLETKSDQIKLISQRVDEMAEDENFVLLTGFMGNDTCSLGVEGNSQRVRDMLNKNCTQDELLTAVSHLLRAKYKKIKLFMIANIPGETREDVMEVVELAKKIAKLRDDLGAKCDIKFSWTPLQIQSFTPMQFCRPTLEKRTLSDVFPALKAIGVSFRLGSGAKYDEAFYLQALHLADRRLWPVLRKLVEERGFVHYGSCAKGTKAFMEQELHGIFPTWEPNVYLNADHEPTEEIIWDIWFHEKEYGEVLPWDYINVAVTKDYLWKRYLDFQNAVQSTKCDQLCDLCGVCDKFDHQLRHKLHENEDPEVDVTDVKVVKQRGHVQRIRLKIETPANRRLVENEYWKFYVRRAFYQLDLPLDKRSIMFASDMIPFKNHLYGVDYIDAKFFEIVDREKLFDDLLTRPDPDDNGQSLLGKWKLLGAKSYTSGMVGVRSVPAMTHYVMPFDRQDEGVVASKLERVLRSPTVDLIVKSEGFMGIQKDEIDARPMIHDLWAAREGNSLKVHMILMNRLSPYDLYNYLFPTVTSKLYGIPAGRVDMYLEVDETQEDFFRPTCIDTGRAIEVDLFDNPVSPDYCLKAMHAQGGVLLHA